LELWLGAVGNHPKHCIDRDEKALKYWRWAYDKVKTRQKDRLLAGANIKCPAGKLEILRPSQKAHSKSFYSKKRSTLDMEEWPELQEAYNKSKPAIEHWLGALGNHPKHCTDREERALRYWRWAYEKVKMRVSTKWQFSADIMCPAGKLQVETCAENDNPSAATLMKPT